MTLSPRQFGMSDERFDQITGSHWRTFTNQPGEPKPEDYNREGDFLADHKRWFTAHAAGKPFVDNDVRQVKGEARERMEHVDRPHVEKQRTFNKQSAQLGRAVRQLNAVKPHVRKPPKISRPAKPRKRRYL